MLLPLLNSALTIPWAWLLASIHRSIRDDSGVSA